MPLDLTNLPKVDWVKSPVDDRDNLYLIRSVLRPEAVEEPAPTRPKLHAGPYVRIDQGQEGACVGFAVANDLLGSPVRVRPPGYDKARTKVDVANAFAQALFVAARRDHDEWVGENYDGTSVRAGMLAARAAGYIGEFRWIRSADDLRRTIHQVGPVIIGIPWTYQMYFTDSQGTVLQGGDLVGGHALCVNGHYPKRYGRAQYRARQSWGPGVGLNGDVFFDEDFLHHLLFVGDPDIGSGEAAAALSATYGPIAA